MNTQISSVVLGGGVLQRLNWWAENSPQRLALTSVDGNCSYTYSELRRTIAAYAQSLRDQMQIRVNSETRVLVVSDSSVEAYISILACMWAGAVVAVADANVPKATMQDYKGTVRPHLVLTPGALSEKWNGEQPSDNNESCYLHGRNKWLIEQNGEAFSIELSSESEKLPVPDYSPLSPQIMLFTSGTTGKSKAVMLPQQSFLAVPDLIRCAELDWITWCPEEVTYTPLPSSHIGGLWWNFNGLASGCHVVAGHSADILGAVRRWQVNTMCMVPTLMGIIATQVRQGITLPSELRLIVYGGSRAIPQDVAVFEENGVHTAQIYGLSETGCTAVCLPTSPNVLGSGRNSLELIASGAVGQPYPGVEVCVLADTTARPPEWVGSDAQCSVVPSEKPNHLLMDRQAIHPISDSVGTLWIRTPARMLGYFGNTAQTAKTIHNGWINTGDRVAIQRYGSHSDPIIYLRGRVSELIICGGVNVNPDDVDAIAIAVPGVQEAAAFAIPDPTFGELVGLAVVPSLPDTDEGTQRNIKRLVARHFRAHANGESRPAHILIVDSLPRTLSGKVRRHELQNIYRRHAK